MKRWIKIAFRAVLGATVLPAVYVAVYLALVTPSYTGSLDGIGFDLERGTANVWSRDFFEAQYGFAGRWNCLKDFFRPINSTDRRLRPDNWEQLRRHEVSHTVSG